MFTSYGITMGVVMMILGGFLPTLSIISSDMTKIKKLFVEILMLIAIFLFCGFGSSQEDKNWNGGYCVECGTKYECIGKSRTSAEYDYSCPNCFHKATH